MNLREFELEQTVTLRDVLKALEKAEESHGSTHEVDLGEFGHHYIECCSDLDVNEILQRLRK